MYNGIRDVRLVYTIMVEILTFYISIVYVSRTELVIIFNISLATTLILWRENFNVIINH